jgi:hypothetical protein
MQPGTEKALGSSLPEAISPDIMRAQEAFRRDLPELLRNRRVSQAWVAYYGDRRIGFGKSKTELFQERPHDIDLSRDV